MSGGFLKVLQHQSLLHMQNDRNTYFIIYTKYLNILLVSEVTGTGQQTALIILLNLIDANMKSIHSYFMFVWIRENSVKMNKRTYVTQDHKTSHMGTFFFNLDFT